MSISPDSSYSDLPQAPRVGFLAVGFAGIRLIAHLPDRVPEFGFAAIDTDSASLQSCPFSSRILVGQAQTGGLGTGSNPDLARECGENEMDAWEPWLHQHEVVFIVCGLGGGTGGGLGPLIAERAQEMGKIVMVAAVRPLDAEGGHRRHAADAALARFRDVSEAVFLFPLDSLRQNNQSQELPLPKVVARCGQEIARSLGGVAILLRTGFLFPLTLQDIIQVMKRADGYCRVASISADGEDRLPAAMDELFAHPLMERGTLLAQSGGLVLGILSGPETTVKELEHITREIRSVLRTDAELKIGIGLDDRFGKRLALVVMAAERWSSRAVPLSVATEREPDLESDELNLEEGETDPKLIQGEIKLDAIAKGRFKDVEPTIVEGADLDTPTFIRLGIRLKSKQVRK